MIVFNIILLLFRILTLALAETAVKSRHGFVELKYLVIFVSRSPWCGWEI